MQNHVSNELNSQKSREGSCTVHIEHNLFDQEY